MGQGGSSGEASAPPTKQQEQKKTDGASLEQARVSSIAYKERVTKNICAMAASTENGTFRSSIQTCTVGPE